MIRDQVYDDVKNYTQQRCHRNRVCKVFVVFSSSSVASTLVISILPRSPIRTLHTIRISKSPYHSRIHPFVLFLAVVIFASHAVRYFLEEFKHLHLDTADQLRNDYYTVFYVSILVSYLGYGNILYGYLL